MLRSMIEAPGKAMYFLFEPRVQHEGQNELDADVIKLFENAEVTIMKREGKGKFGISVKKEMYQQRKGDTSKGDTVHFAPTEIDLHDRAILGLINDSSGGSEDLNLITSEEEFLKKLDPVDRWKIMVEKEGASRKGEEPELLRHGVKVYSDCMALLEKTLNKYEKKQLTSAEALKECNALLSTIKRTFANVPEDHRPTFEHLIAEKMEQQYPHAAAEKRKELMTRYQAMKIQITGGFEVSGARGAGAPCNGKFFASKNYNGHLFYQNNHTGAIIYFDHAWKMQFNGNTEDYYYLPQQEEKTLNEADVRLLKGHYANANGAVHVMTTNEEKDEFKEAWAGIAKNANESFMKFRGIEKPKEEVIQEEIEAAREKVLGMRILRIVIPGEDPVPVTGWSEQQIFDEIDRQKKEGHQPSVVFTRPFPMDMPPPEGKWVAAKNNIDGRDFCTLKITEGAPVREPASYGFWKGGNHEFLQIMSCGVYEGCHNWYHNKHGPQEEMEAHQGHPIY